MRCYRKGLANVIANCVRNARLRRAARAKIGMDEQSASKQVCSALVLDHLMRLSHDTRMSAVAYVPLAYLWCLLPLKKK
jgi:hypothetical protein